MAKVFLFFVFYVLSMAFMYLAGASGDLEGMVFMFICAFLSMAATIQAFGEYVRYKKIKKHLIGA